MFEWLKKLFNVATDEPVAPIEVDEMVEHAIGDDNYRAFVTDLKHRLKEVREHYPDYRLRVCVPREPLCFMQVSYTIMLFFSDKSYLTMIAQTPDFELSFDNCARIYVRTPIQVGGGIRYSEKLVVEIPYITSNT